MNACSGWFLGWRKGVVPIAAFVGLWAWGFLQGEHRAEGEPSVLRVAAKGSSASDAAQTGPYRKAEVDPIAANGPIFVDWPKPRAVLMFSGEMDGYLEPCGCAGLENQKGGLKRRHTLVKQMEERGWPVASFDLGGLTKRIGLQAEIKYRRAIESLIKIGYTAVGIGAKELRLSIDAVAYALANIDPESNPLVSANVGIYGMESGFARAFQVVEVGGKRIGATSVLGAKHIQELAGSDDLELLDPTEAVAKVAPLLAAERCDVQVLMVHGDPAEAETLARKFPQFDMVLSAGGAEEPPNRPAAIEGSRAMRIEVGHKGMYVVVVGLYDDPQAPLRYQRVPLDARFPDSAEMQAMLVSYQSELEQMTLKGLGLTGSSHPEGEFVGSETCGDCHTQAMDVFVETGHAHATDTLVKLDPPRHFDPECLSCHVVGWNPQEYFPYSSGYFGLQETPHLLQNGCENCHGPGAAHVAAEMGEEEVSDAEQEARRAAMRMKIVANEGNGEGQVLGQVVKNCLECHDLDNSPDFDFQEYWPHVKHSGMD
jgi:hypothetical protein